MSHSRASWSPRTSGLAGFLVLAFIAIVSFAVATPVHADGVYTSGLFQLGDGEPPPGMPGLANILESAGQAGPDWGSLFSADGSARDEYDGEGNPGANGVPDYLEIYGGLWAVFNADDISLGSGFEGSALYPDGRIYNSTVTADHDLGNAYVYFTLDSVGNVVLYAAAERLGGGDSSLEFEFNQEHFRLGRGGYGVGVPWEVLGDRSTDDVLVKLTFAGGMLATAEASAWDGQGWIAVSTVAGEGCDGADALCAVCNGDVIEGGPWNAQQVGAGRFVEMGINVGALLGAQPVFTTVRLRTPQDAAFGYFGEGN